MTLLDLPAEISVSVSGYLTAQSHLFINAELFNKETPQTELGMPLLGSRFQYAKCCARK
jgi:hypothetical protein